MIILYKWYVFMFYMFVYHIIKPPLATARAASCDGPVHLFVCLSVCLFVAKIQKKRDFLKN